MHPLTKTAALVGTLAAFTSLVTQAQDRSVPDGVWVRDGYKLTVAESTIKSPRFLLNGPNGSLYVSVIKSGEIKTLKDNDGDGYFESVTTYVDGFTGKQMLQGM
ncbi:hypothetical protein OAH36_04685, partial [Verrucomicrobia bacterium]|nr:hypothetical protein [Verrucomicrobiota bacterium]